MKFFCFYTCNFLFKGVYYYKQKRIFNLNNIGEKGYEKNIIEKGY